MIGLEFQQRALQMIYLNTNCFVELRILGDIFLFMTTILTFFTVECCMTDFKQYFFKLLFR